MEIPYTVAARPDTGLNNGRIGIWLFLASEVMLFGALFSSYVLLRTGDPAFMHIPHEVAEKLELKLGQVAQPIRVAVSGGPVSPGIDVTLELLGREKTLERLERAILFIQDRGES